MSLFDHMDNLYSVDSGANGLPISARPELPLITPDQHIAGPEDFWSSLLHEISGENAKAIYYALTGLELGSDTTVSEGHKHDTEITCEEWRALWRGSFCEKGSASSTSGIPSTQGGIVITNTNFSTLPLLSGSFVLRRGINWIYPRIRVELNSASRFLQVKLEIRDESIGGNLVNPAPFYQVTAHIDTNSNEWYVYEPINLGGFFEIGTPARQVVHCFWWAKVASGASPSELVEAHISYLSGW